MIIITFPHKSSSLPRFLNRCFVTLPSDLFKSFLFEFLKGDDQISLLTVLNIRRCDRAVWDIRMNSFKHKVLELLSNKEYKLDYLYGVRQYKPFLLENRNFVIQAILRRPELILRKEFAKFRNDEKVAKIIFDNGDTYGTDSLKFQEILNALNPFVFKNYWMCVALLSKTPISNVSKIPVEFLSNGEFILDIVKNSKSFKILSKLNLKLVKNGELLMIQLLELTINHDIHGHEHLRTILDTFFFKDVKYYKELVINAKNYETPHSNPVEFIPACYEQNTRFWMNCLTLDGEITHKHAALVLTTFFERRVNSELLQFALTVPGFKMHKLTLQHLSDEERIQCMPVLDDFELFVNMELTESQCEILFKYSPCCWIRKKLVEPKLDELGNHIFKFLSRCTVDDLMRALSKISYKLLTFQFTDIVCNYVGSRANEFIRIASIKIDEQYELLIKYGVKKDLYMTTIPSIGIQLDYVEQHPEEYYNGNYNRDSLSLNSILGRIGCRNNDTHMRMPSEFLISYRNESLAERTIIDSWDIIPMEELKELCTVFGSNNPVTYLKMMRTKLNLRKSKDNERRKILLDSCGDEANKIVLKSWLNIEDKRILIIKGKYLLGNSLNDKQNALYFEDKTFRKQYLEMDIKYLFKLLGYIDDLEENLIKKALSLSDAFIVLKERKCYDYVSIKVIEYKIRIPKDEFNADYRLFGDVPFLQKYLKQWPEDFKYISAEMKHMKSLAKIAFKLEENHQFMSSSHLNEFNAKAHEVERKRKADKELRTKNKKPKRTTEVAINEIFSNSK